jgi:lipoyl(octanoyl) transferase
LGRNALSSNLLFPENVLKAKQVELYPTDRGGDVTYHGPGQIVGYPILDLEPFRMGLKTYIHTLEEAIIRTLSDYGLRGERLNGATGVWLDASLPKKVRKIAAIGVRSSQYVVMHGFALNVNTDLDYFRLIHPCGFTDKGVTSLRQERGREVLVDEVKQRLVRHFERLFSAE